VGPGAGADAVFLALADGRRRELLSALAERPATATELARGGPISRQAVLKHLNALEEAGLVSRERSGREVRYTVTPAPLSGAVTWIATVGSQWDERLVALARAFEARS
jgi:DNA-binding transcriptional ArsR family regulator